MLIYLVGISTQYEVDHTPCADALLVNELESRLVQVLSDLAYINVGGVGLQFFAASCNRSGRGLTPGSIRQAKREGLAIELARAIIASPHYHEELPSWYLKVY